MAIHIVHTSTDGAAARTLVVSEWGNVSVKLQRVSDKRTLRTISNKAVSVVYNRHVEIAVDVRGIYQDMTDSSGAYVFGQIMQFISLVNSGERFEWRGDSAKVGNTLVTSDQVEGVVVMPVDDYTSFSIGDSVYFESLEDETKGEVKKLTSVDQTFGALGELTFATGAAYGYADGSIVRHDLYHPDCVIKPGSVTLVEQQGGRGYKLWDLRFKAQEVNA